MNNNKDQVILDNQTPELSVGEYLRKQLTSDVPMVRIVSAYFTVYAYESLQQELEQIDKVRFLYGDPGSVGEVDPGEKSDKSFDLSESGLSPAEVLQQKRIARECAKWIEQKVDVRTIKKTNFLHGKMYHITHHSDPDQVVLGSSNFTRRGLGFNRGANIELNTTSSAAENCDAFKQWFDDIWNNQKFTQDAKQEVLDALSRLGNNCSPELVYFKTLFELFRARIDSRELASQQISESNFRDTKIWKTLYSFQQDGVSGIISRLEQYNGCILADSVGLGKTYTALAVIRYYQQQGKQVLVLCPKKLSENWKIYSTHFKQIQNPFKEDNFNYTVLYHTDLSRSSGESNSIDLANFDWGEYGLVVIDESHNFRNQSSDVKNEDGEIIRRSRYQRLLEDIIKQGSNTHVLMLSATPVNTSLTDLRSQIYLMTGKQDDFFKETLGIPNIRYMLGAAQKRFNEWEQSERKDKQDLIDELGGQFSVLLDAISIARSRRHVKNFYRDAVKEIGGFPEIAAPQNKYPPTDENGKLSYEELNEDIRNFQLSIYMLTNYVKDEQVLQRIDQEKQDFNFDQTDREKSLISMLRINFLKRLESSAYALALTLSRTIKKIDKILYRINEYQDNAASQKENSDYNATEYQEDHEEIEHEDEDFIVNKARHPFYFRDLDIKRWCGDLKGDRKVLKAAHKKVVAITPERDSKLIELKSVLREKLTNPTTNNFEEKNRKALVFTAFKDTAEYLYKQLQPLAKECDANFALVAGDVTRTTFGKNKFNEILTNFSPVSRVRGQYEVGNSSNDNQPQIDVLIATDCVSEGQNLQDCDLVINYDIHWNPVRLIQRFGRINRIGSRNEMVRMVNFWPTKELDYYLNLKDRVEARMVLMDAAATGDEHLVDGDTKGQVEENANRAKVELSFRDAQLARLREETLDLEDLDEGVSLTDFSLDDFIAQLMSYLEQNREKLEDTPLGVYAIASCVQPQQDDVADADPGVIFCLRHRNPPPDNRSRNPLDSYYLVYIRNNGEVRYNYMQAKKTLNLFAAVARGESKPLQTLCDIFDRETENAKNMDEYNRLLEKVVAAVSEKFNQQGTKSINTRDGKLPKKSEQPKNLSDFELVTWLVIKNHDS